MSKVSYEPNNTKNGHLGAKLEPIENRKFPKNHFHTPTNSDGEPLKNKFFDFFGQKLGYFLDFTVDLRSDNDV